jgi:MFS transporter, DHA2 family, glioxin efflux transporter
MPDSLNCPDWVFLYYLPIYFQSIQGLSALDSGVDNLPTMALFAVGCLVSRTIIGKIGYYQPFQTISGIVTTAGSAAIYTLGINSSKSRYLGSQVPLGLGIGLGVQIAVTAIRGFSDPEDLGPSTGIALSKIDFPFLRTIFWALSQPRHGC